MTIDIATASIIAAIATAVGVVLGSLITVFGNWLNNRQIRRQQNEQWEREEKKALRETEERRLARQIEERLKQKEALQEIYGNCVRYLSAIYTYTHDQERAGYKEQELQLYEDLREAQRHLSLMVINHYDKESPEFKNFLDAYSKFFSTRNNFVIADALKQSVIKFAASDPRLIDTKTQ